MSLNEYRDKRNFDKTPEPPPREHRKKQAGEPLIFVIQKHAASRLHYDLRLEENGELASWAIPKSPPRAEGEKRLAVRTENHALEYADFEGVIPEGEYGAGKVEIWDKGDYSPIETAPGKRIFDIRGDKIRGRYALIKLRPGKGEKDVNWLFFKLKENA